MVEEATSEINKEAEDPIVLYTRKGWEIAGLTYEEKVTVLRLFEVFSAPSIDAECSTNIGSVEKRNSRPNTNTHGVLISSSILYGTRQWVAETLLHPRLIYVCPYFLQVGYQSERGWFNSIRKKLYWTHTLNDWQGTVLDSRSCA